MSIIRSISVGLVLLSCKAFGQYNPQRDLGDLFVHVQMARIFPDSKTFADCIPLFPVDSIKVAYVREELHPGFDLKNFVNAHFRIQPSSNDKWRDSFPSIERHIDDLWDRLVRYKNSSEGSLIGLPYPYIVPGGRFNEMYYWDSYFTMLGLQTSGKISTMQHMVDNFAFLIDRYGFIPNGNRTYYLTRSQPPFFSLMVDLLASATSDTTSVHYLPQLLKEYNFWMDGTDMFRKNLNAYKRVVRIAKNTVLNHYWDDDTIPRAESFREDVELASQSNKSKGTVYRNIRAACESGWDFSSRWFADGISLSTIHTTDIIPVDLNCLLYHLEMTLAKSYHLKGDEAQSALYKTKSITRKEAILYYCWDKERGFFTDYDLVKQQSTGVLTLAGCFPLFFRIAETSQARKAADKIQKYFLSAGGVLTTITLINQQWDAPNGWAPLQWITCEGLRNYWNITLADTIKTRWLRTIKETYNKSGKLLEKYNVLYPSIPGGGGEYPTQDGFGWTNGVFVRMNSEN